MRRKKSRKRSSVKRRAVHRRSPKRRRRNPQVTLQENPRKRRRRPRRSTSKRRRRRSVAHTPAVRVRRRGRRSVTVSTRKGRIRSRRRGRGVYVSARNPEDLMRLQENPMSVMRFTMNQALMLGAEKVGTLGSRLLTGLALTKIEALQTASKEVKTGIVILGPLLIAFLLNWFGVRQRSTMVATIGKGAMDACIENAVKNLLPTDWKFTELAGTYASGQILSDETKAAIQALIGQAPMPATQPGLTGSNYYGATETVPYYGATKIEWDGGLSDLALDLAGEDFYDDGYADIGEPNPEAQLQRYY